MHNALSDTILNPLKYRLYKSFKTYAPIYIKWCIRKIERKYAMLKISRIARHTTLITCGCPKGSESQCGIMYRTW